MRAILTRQTITRPVAFFGVPRTPALLLLLPGIAGAFFNRELFGPISTGQVGVMLTFVLAVTAWIIFRRNPDAWTIWTARVRTVKSLKREVFFDAG